MDKRSLWSPRPPPAFFRLHHSTTNGPRVPEGLGREQRTEPGFAVSLSSARAKRREAGIWHLHSDMHAHGT